MCAVRDAGTTASVSDLLRVLVVLGLVALNAFLVVGEYAIVTARRSALLPRAEDGSAGARVALRLMDDPVRVISTIQVGITAVGVLLGAVGETLVADLSGGAVPGGLGFLLSFALVTYLSVVFGELVPKALTLAHTEALAVFIARPIDLVARVLRPAVWLVDASGRLVLRPFGVREVMAGSSVSTPEELRALVDEAEDAGVLPRAQEEMLHNVLAFPSLEAGDVMVPEPEIVWLDADEPVETAFDRALACAHTRYPVAREMLDRLVGAVHVRDLAVAVRRAAAPPDTRGPAEPRTVGELVRPVPVVPETKDLGALLREMREQHEQLAIVADEHGGVIGLVTLEDILEELVGEIADEFDLPDARLQWIDERTVRVAGSMTIDDFGEAVGVDLPARGRHTLAGLVFDGLGRRPVAGDELAIDELRFAVEEMDGMRIARLRVLLPRPAARGEPGPSP